jgi:hypothetical protein
VVEERKERPVDQPCASLELCEWVVEEACVDGFFDLVDFFDSGFPVYGEDFTGQFAPGRLVGLVVVCGLSLSQYF